MEPPSESEFTVGWIAPMALELTAARAMLEDRGKMQISKDDASYHIGRIGQHWVVMNVCPNIGTHAAARVLANMRRSFPNIKHILMAGIGGGVPGYGTGLEHQILLGDVVVGLPEESEGGVIHYEYGVWEGNGSLSQRGHLLHPTDALMHAVRNIQSEHMSTPERRIPQLLGKLQRDVPEFRDPGPDHDHLFPDDYPHLDKNEPCEELCDFSRSKSREDRGCEAARNNRPQIHYGTIGSANTLVVSTAKRNELYKKHKIICFEMEAAGIVDSQQALVIRGISDYSDSHKNKRWQFYAAATAAAYAREVILALAEPSTSVKEAPPPSQDPVSACLRSLAYPEMESRSHDIEGAAQGTCRWLLGHDMYRRWEASDRGILWIKGGRGSGKSTLLKYALANRTVREADIVLSFFFHDRGDELQKTRLGFFRSLTYQLLQQAPDALRNVVGDFERKVRVVGSPGEDWQWHRNELRDHLGQALSKVLQGGRPIWLFVDALDKAGEESAVDIFQWLKFLLSDLPHTGSRCHFCVTCNRHSIFNRGCEFEVYAEYENMEDIFMYVKAQLSESKELVSSEIPNVIAIHASGSFILALDMMKKVLELCRDGESARTIEGMFESIIVQRSLSPSQEPEPARRSDSDGLPGKLKLARECYSRGDFESAYEAYNQARSEMLAPGASGSDQNLFEAHDRMALCRLDRCVREIEHSPDYMQRKTWEGLKEARELSLDSEKYCPSDVVNEHRALVTQLSIRTCRELSGPRAQIDSTVMDGLIVESEKVRDTLIGLQEAGCEVDELIACVTRLRVSRLGVS